MTSLFHHLVKMFLVFYLFHQFTYFYEFLTGKNFVQWFLILWWASRFLTKSLWRIFFFVLILKQHENRVMTASNSWWCYFSVVKIIHCSMNECLLVFLIDGKGNGHSIWACSVDYSFHKININPLKLIVTDTQTILFKIYHLRSSRVTMKQFSQACMKRNVFLSIMGDLKNSVTFTLNVHRFGSMRKQNLKI